MARDGDSTEGRGVRRLFIPGRLDETVTLSGSDAHHLGYTLRARSGERVVVVDAARQVASMEIVSFTSDTVTLRLVERLAADTEPPIRLTLAVCLLKADKMDFVVQKAVELGVAKVQPLESELRTRRRSNADVPRLWKWRQSGPSGIGLLCGLSKTARHFSATRRRKKRLWARGSRRHRETRSRQLSGRRVASRLLRRTRWKRRVLQR